MGTFVAGGVTANNVLAARDVVNTPKFNLDDNAWHNNNWATNQFWVQDASQVVGAWDADGPVTSDPVLGATVMGDGVMADLDPEHRRVTDLFGFALAIEQAPEKQPLLSGTLRTTQLRDFWVTTAKVEGGVFPVSTAWQSVLRRLAWSPHVDRSRVLRQLRERSSQALSFRMTMTRYNANHPDVRFGTFLAVIGPYHDGEPEQIVPGRRLLPPGAKPPYGGYPAASCLVDERRRKLVVDLANLVPRTLQRPATLLRNLTARIGGTGIGSPRDLSLDDWIKHAGLVEWGLTTAQQGALAGRPLQLEFTQDGQTDPSQLNEHPDGKYIDVDRRSHRLNPGDRVSIPVYARRFGKPLAGEVVPFHLKKQTALSPIASLQIPKDNPFYPPDPDALINSAPDDVFVHPPPYSVKTDAHGHAVLTLEVKPGPFTFPPERKLINSQLYFLGDPDGWQRWGALGPEVGAGCALTVLVFNKRAAPTYPTWAEVAPILGLFARLYPIMKQVVDLTDESAVRDNAFRIRQRLTAGVDSVAYMPMTRELSASDRELVVRYLDGVIATHKGGQESR
jgi:hypothetical protein